MICHMKILVASLLVVIVLPSCGVKGAPQRARDVPVPAPAAALPAIGPPPPIAAGGLPVTVVGLWFSPKGGCEAALVSAIGTAHSSCLVQDYALADPNIENALVSAKGRDVDVEVILDSKWNKADAKGMDVLLAGGVPVFLDPVHAIAHNKITIIDDQIVLTGSFNYTTSAEGRNAENLIMLFSRDLADRYTANWRVHRAHSVAASETTPVTTGATTTGDATGVN